MWSFVEQHYLSLLIFLPLLMALFAPMISDKEDGKFIHYFGIGGMAFLFLLSVLGWNGILTPQTELVPWIQSLGINYAVGSDGLSFTLVALTNLLFLVAAVASITNITKRLKLYYALLFILQAAIIGVFVARDFFLFFLFWELELIPMYLLIAIWGGPRREFAAMKFALYTLFGSVFLVAGILALYFHVQNTHIDPSVAFYFSSVKAAIMSSANPMPLASQILIFSAFFITFAIKLPTVPFHTWLPDAHVEAPTPVSMLLAGILLKMGSYGLLRFCFEFFPDAAKVMVPYVAVLAVINIVYTAGVALVQEDMKKLIAYSSVSHMGFVLLGLAALNQLGFNGAVFVMFSHGLVSAALFMCVGTLYHRTHTRQISEYGGFGSQVPILFYYFLFMGMASLGLPLLVSFASETLVFYGAFVSTAFSTVPLFGQEIPWSIQSITVVSALGVVIGAAYTLWLIKKVFTGPLDAKWANLKDATPSEVFVLGTLAALVLAYGFMPQMVMRQFEPTVSAIAQLYDDYTPIAAKSDAGVMHDSHNKSVISHRVALPTDVMTGAN